MIRRTFSNDEMQRRFEEDGYLIISLFSPDDIKELERIYSENRVGEQAAIETTLKEGNYELTKRIQLLTGALFQERLKPYLIDHRLLHAGFIVKTPGKPNAVRLHQDSTFVDETRFRALNIWSPLVDVDETNGAMWIVKHSDKFFQGLRGQPFKEYDCNDLTEEIMAKYGTLLKMKAGEALIFDVALFHYSAQNTSGKARGVCNAIMVPAEATALFCHYNQEKKVIQKYAIDEDFLLRYYTEYLPAEDVKAPLLESIPFSGPRKISAEEYEDKYYQYNPKGKSGLIGYLSKMLKLN